MMKQGLFVLLATALMTLAAGTVQASPFSEQSCAKYSKNIDFTKALTVVATNMKSSVNELCGLERLMDVYIVNRNFYTEQGEPIPHVWVTLHYAEHSCQYFVRNADWVVTQKNCYNTW